MTDTKNPKTLFILKVVFTSLSGIIGIVLTVVLWNLYFSGVSQETNPFTVESITSRSVFLILSGVLFLVMIIASLVFNLLGYRIKDTRTPTPVNQKEKAWATRRDFTKMTDEAKADYRKAKKTVFILSLVTGILVLGLLVFPFCYVVNPKNFSLHGNLMEQTVRMGIHTLPFLFGAYLLIILSSHLAKKPYRTMLADLKGLPYINPTTPEQIRRSTLIRNILRVILFAVAVTFIIIGLVRHEAVDIMNKAINICTECIGLG